MKGEYHMLYPRYRAPLHIRVYRDIIWYTRFFFTIVLPHLEAGLATAALFILLPILAAFVV